MKLLIANAEYNPLMYVQLSMELIALLGGYLLIHFFLLI